MREGDGFPGEIEGRRYHFWGVLISFRNPPLEGSHFVSKTPLEGSNLISKTPLDFMKSRKYIRRFRAHSITGSAWG